MRLKSGIIAACDKAILGSGLQEVASLAGPD